MISKNTFWILAIGLTVCFVVADRDDDSDARDDAQQGPALRRKRAAAQIDKNSDKLWENPIHYKIASGLKSKTKNLLKEAMKYIEDRTCLNFKEGKSENYLKFEKTSKRCSSFYGMQGGKQKVFVAEEGSESCMAMLLMSHEIGHALGMEHEMKRDDRGSHIKIIKDNLLVPAQFKKSSKTNKIGPYDESSMMQYDRKFGGKPGHKTMDSKEAGMEFWLRRRTKTYGTPSFLDIKAINILYGCMAKCSGHEDCQNGGYKAGGSCRCQCTEGWKGKHCQHRAYKDCGEKLDAKEGEIGTPVFTDDPISTSMVDKTCEWAIKTGSKDNKVLLSFMDFFHIENMDDGRENYVEPILSGDGQRGPRLSGTRDHSKMAYIMHDSTEAVIKMGIKNTNGFGVGFKAKYQVLSQSLYNKCKREFNSEEPVCFNGGKLSDSCSCECRDGYSGKQCDELKGECSGKLPCLNKGVLQVSESGCPCDCPFKSGQLAAVLGQSCEYFGYCYQRLKGSHGSVTKLIRRKGKKVGGQVQEDENVCPYITKDGTFREFALCPVTRETPCDCANVLPESKCKKLAKKKAGMCGGNYGWLCMKYCNTCEAWKDQ